MTIADLIVALRRHTDIKYIEIQIEINEKTTDSTAVIGFPDNHSGYMAHFIQAYAHEIPKVEWSSVGWNHELNCLWKRIRFRVTY